MRQESVKKVLLVDPRFIQKKRVCPDEEKKHQKLMLKRAEIQKRSANDSRERRVCYDFFDNWKHLFLHNHHLFDSYSLLCCGSKREQETDQFSQEIIKGTFFYFIACLPLAINHSLFAPPPNIVYAQTPLLFVKQSFEASDCLQKAGC